MHLRRALCLLMPAFLVLITLQVMAEPTSPPADENAVGEAPLAALSPASDLGGRLQTIAVEPAEISLDRPYSYVQLLVTGTLDDGSQIDLTRDSTIESPVGLVSVDEHRLIRAAENGAGTLTVSYGEQTVEVPLAVGGQGEAFHPDFIQDVNPILSRVGCNAGTCHGAKEGKNGFKLSLRGYDAEFDHRSLVDDLAGRRFNRAAPDQSLMLLKPIGAVPHMGGALIDPDSPYYQVLRAWIADGVQLDLNSPRVTSIDIFPKDTTLPAAGWSQQMRVVATYADGSQRDVTAESFIESSDTEVLVAGERGLMNAVRRGEAAVLVRYEGNYAGTRVFVMGDRSGYEWQETPAYNHIDELVYDKLRQMRILPSELCTDEEFCRRVYLDLAGTPPSLDQLTMFLADERPSREKREALVDSLIGSEPFIDNLTYKWADLLQVNQKYLTAENARAYYDWIRQAIAENKPYDEFAYEVLTASGSTMADPAAAYWKIHRDPAATMENTTHLFLATRFNCNKCHDHPFERWTQDQYYHLGAFFARVERGADGDYAGEIAGGEVEGNTPAVEIITDAPEGEMVHERTGQVAEPEFPYTFEGMPPTDGSRREQLARWITSPTNPYFAKSYVNRIWAYLMGVGLIEPIDDIRAGNPPSNPELLDWLTEQFIASGFDTRQLMRQICTSRTYQLSISSNVWNEDDHLNYSHRLPKRLTAEQLYDAVHLVTGSESQLPGMPPGARAVQMADNSTSLPDGFFTLFGRPPRESACECERTSGVMLGPVMNLVNGPTIADAIADPDNALTEIVRSEADDSRVVDLLFLRILNRHPTAEEQRVCVDIMQENSFDADMDAAQAAIAAVEAEIDAQQTAWEQQWLDQDLLAWNPLTLVEGASEAGTEFTSQDDASIVVGGELARDTYTLVFHTDSTDISGLLLEALPQDELPGLGPGRAPNGNFVVSEFEVSIAPAADPSAAQALVLGNPQADFSQDGWPVANSIDGNLETGWAIHPQTGKSHRAVYEAAENFGFPGGTVVTVTLRHNYNDGMHNLGHLRVSLTRAPRPLSVEERPSLAADLLTIIHTPAGERTEEQAAKLREYHRSLHPNLAELRDKANQLATMGDRRLYGAQDIAWALINSPAFLFNR